MSGTRPTPRNRSTRLIAIGVAVLVVGVGMAILALRAAGGASATPITSDTSATADEPSPAPSPSERLPEQLSVPKGHEAVALQLPFDASMAGMPTPGQHVDVYGVFTHGRPGATEPMKAAQDQGPVVQRVLTDVEVLAVTGPEASDAGGSPTVVVALTPSQASTAIFLQANERIWLTIPGKDVPGDATDTARDYESVLR